MRKGLAELIGKEVDVKFTDGTSQLMTVKDLDMPMIKLGVDCSNFVDWKWYNIKIIDSIQDLDESDFCKTKTPDEYEAALNNQVKQ